MAQQRIGQRQGVEQLISPVESSTGSTRDPYVEAMTGKCFVNQDSTLGLRGIWISKWVLKEKWLRAQNDLDFQRVLRGNWLRVRRGFGLGWLIWAQVLHFRRVEGSGSVLWVQDSQFGFM